MVKSISKDGTIPKGVSMQSALTKSTSISELVPGLTISNSQLVDPSTIILFLPSGYTLMGLTLKDSFSIH